MAFLLTNRCLTSSSLLNQTPYKLFIVISQTWGDWIVFGWSPFRFLKVGKMKLDDWLDEKYIVGLGGTIDSCHLQNPISGRNKIIRKMCFLKKNFLAFETLSLKTVSVLSELQKSLDPGKDQVETSRLSRSFIESWNSRVFIRLGVV